MGLEKPMAFTLIWVELDENVRLKGCSERDKHVGGAILPVMSITILKH